MVTVEQRPVRADGGFGIMDLVLCTEARGMRLVMGVTVSTPTRLTGMLQNGVRFKLGQQGGCTQHPLPLAQLAKRLTLFGDVLSATHQLLHTDDCHQYHPYKET